MREIGVIYIEKARIFETRPVWASSKSVPQDLLEPVIRLADLAEVREGLERLIHDCTASDFNEHWESYKEAQCLLARLPKEEKK